MNILQNKEEKKLVLALEGRLDTVTAPQLEEVVNGIEGITELVLDLKKLEYVSSAGLRVILAAQKKMNVVGSMTVTNVSEIVMEVFDLTGFADILDIK